MSTITQDNLFGGKATLRIEPDAKGDEDEDGWIGRDVAIYEPEETTTRAPLQKRNGHGIGTMDWEQADGFTGW